jgi:predicted Zn-dependent protease
MTLLVLLAMLAQPYSREKEIALGKSLAGDLARHSTLLEDETVTAYVNRIGTSLAKAAGLDYPVDVRVVVGREARSAGFPGGYFFLSAGVVNAAESEAELAAVLAHELGHVAARHGMRQASSRGSVPVIYTGGWLGFCTRLSRGDLVPAPYRLRLEALEPEADRLATQYLERAGYDPEAVARIYERLGRIDARPERPRPSLRKQP